MPDIQLRLDKDMLVVSAPLDAALARQGFDIARDRQYLNLMEPDAIADALHLEQLAGAQCLVTSTEDITRARLAHVRMEDDARKLAMAAVETVASLKPQHILAEIGPCGLPLDPSSKASLNENRAQYADAARAFEGCKIDAFLLNGFTSLADLKCALMGAAQVSSVPVFASLVVGVPGECDAQNQHVPSLKNAPAADADAPASLEAKMPFAEYVAVEVPPAPPAPVKEGECFDCAHWEEAVAVMADLGAAVVGFETSMPIADAVSLATAARKLCGLPVMAQLQVSDTVPENVRRGLVPFDSIQQYTPATLENAAVKLYGAGVQFLRATGSAASSCTGALAACVSGLDVRLA